MYGFYCLTIVRLLPCFWPFALGLKESYSLDIPFCFWQHWFHLKHLVCAQSINLSLSGKWQRYFLDKGQSCCSTRDFLGPWVLNKGYFHALLGFYWTMYSQQRILLLSYWYFSYHTWQCLTPQIMDLVYFVGVLNVGIWMLMVSGWYRDERIQFFD